MERTVRGMNRVFIAARGKVREKKEKKIGPLMEWELLKF